MDHLTPSERSALMSKIRGKDTGPELAVRRMAHSLGFRFRLHVRNLPGSPDLVFPARRKVIFVHGCFWHDHGCSVAGNHPVTRREYWQEKFDRNRRRDKRVRASLRQLGWQVLVVWECQSKNAAKLSRTLIRFLLSN